MFWKHKNYIPHSRNKDGTRKKVFVGVSGGVDSSVSLALLKDAGFDVTGVFIKVYHPDFLGCEWRDERLDALAVCQKLDVPFLDLDLEKEYKQEVFDYMINTYKKGETPNPDVFCNKYVKFGGFLDFAEKHGCDYVATGHYARHLVKNERSSSSTSQLKNSLYVMYTSFLNCLSPRISSHFLRSDAEFTQAHMMAKGNDNNKDQTYFLYTMPQEKLAKVLFPIGAYPKSKVRKIAEKYDLFTAGKKDSQGLCFVGKVKMKDFLQEFIDKNPGDVLNNRGEVIGSHDGSIFYTKGERHGFEVFPHAKTPDTPRLYVTERDYEHNTITVGPKESLETSNKEYSHEIKITDVNWISGEPNEKERYEGRVRYRGELIGCVIKFSHLGRSCGKKKYLVTFDRPHNAVAKGQSLVLYKGNQCVGGGIIQ